MFLLDTEKWKHKKHENFAWKQCSSKILITNILEKYFTTMYQRLHQYVLWCRGEVCHRRCFSFFFYFLWFFLLSLHSVGDQIGAAPVTCHRNVPALLSISGSTRAGRAVACCRPQTAPGGSSTLTWRIGLGCACACVGVQINTQVCAHVYEASTQPVAPSRDKTCPALLSGLCDVCGLDRAFQRAHHQPGRKRGIWHVSTGIPVTWEMCPAGT